jgi:small GTP-binding protein
MSDDETLKFVILGEGRVGKTSILSKYFTKKFNEGQKSTVNPSFYEKDVNQQGKNFHLKFWDTAGQEQFNAINTMYYQNAVGALLVYDVTIGETFEKVKSWVSTLQEAVGKDIIFVIAGNKFDLSDKNMITKNDEQVNAYCEQEKCKHFYTSAKTGFQLNEAFDSLINSVINKMISSNAGGNRKGRGRKLEIKEQSSTKDKKGCCK